MIGVRRFWGCKTDQRNMVVLHQPVQPCPPSQHSEITQWKIVGHVVVLFSLAFILRLGQNHHRICKTWCPRSVGRGLLIKYTSRAYKSARNNNLWARSFLWVRSPSFYFCTKFYFCSKFFFSVPSLFFLFQVFFFCSKSFFLFQVFLFPVLQFFFCCSKSCFCVPSFCFVCCTCGPPYSSPSRRNWFNVCNMYLSVLVKHTVSLSSDCSSIRRSLLILSNEFSITSRPDAILIHECDTINTHIRPL